MNDYFDDGEEPPPPEAIGNDQDSHTRAMVVTVTDSVEGLREEGKATLRRVDDLEQLLSELGEVVFGTPEGGPWCWRYLDPYETVALFVQVRDWVDWMVPRYLVHQDVLPCWYLHGPAIEELTGLYVSWRSTYKSEPASYSDNLTAFHDRWFWPAIGRMRRLKFFNGCTPLEHKEHDQTYLRTTNPAHFADNMTELMGGVTPGADAEQVHAAIAAKEAVPLRNHTKDPKTPVRWRGTWWAILANSPDGLWVPRPAHVCEKFEELLQKSKTTTKSAR